MTTARAIILFGFVVIASIVTFTTVDFNERIILGGDEYGYYVYLPAVFLHHDLGDLQETLKVRQARKPGTVYPDENGQLRIGEAPAYEGRNVIKYTYGVSVFHFPGFAIGHAIASLSDTHEANGFTPPYFKATFFVSILWICLGMWFLGKFLDEHVAHSTTNLVLLSLAFATNLWHFAAVGVMMSHGIQFMLWAMLLYASSKYWKDGRQTKHLVQLALAIGFICIIRPVEVFCLFVPLFYGINHIKEAGQRIASFFTTHRLHLGFAVGIGLLILFPQLLYWHELTGHWVYDSYPSEHFDFTKPALYRGLFSWHNGFFSYSPILLLIVPGFYFLFRKNPFMGVMVLVLFSLHVYISYSWWCWNYINGVGSRIMTDIYPLLAIPLAYFIDRLFAKRPALFLPVLIPCMVLVTFWVWQGQRGILFSEYGNLPYIRQILFATEHTTEASIAFDTKHYQPAVQPPVYLYEEDFEGAVETSSTELLPDFSSTFYRVDKTSEKPLGPITLSYEEIAPYLEMEYVVIDLDVLVTNQTSDIWNMNTIDLRMKAGDQVVKHNYIRLNNKTGSGKERAISWGKPNAKTPIRIRIPHRGKLKSGGSLEVSFRNPDSAPPLYIDNLKIGFADKE